MATTLTRRIEQLSRHLADKLSADPEEWMGFLRTASKIYLYPFIGQALDLWPETRCWPVLPWRSGTGG